LEAAAVEWVCPVSDTPEYAKGYEDAMNDTPPDYDVLTYATIDDYMAGRKAGEDQKRWNASMQQWSVTL
jgi:hypothetical protein